MPTGISPLATAKVDHLRDVRDRSLPVYGVAIHGTGSAISEKALKHGADCLEFAIGYYLRPEAYFAHYVIGSDGTIAQLAAEHERSPHIGIPADDRQAYLSGVWKARLPKVLVDAWVTRWPAYRSPTHLYPGPSPNNAYVGIELLVWTNRCPGRPHAPGLKYTTAQHAAAAALTLDIASRWIFPTGWQDTGRLACHEDISPLTRTSKGNGWDPGILRPAPWFDWPQFKRLSR
ncbi:MAG TPA: N-acetylmuramoyl-L-alanine amidase [Polyangia bacterium]|jgi:hypothetical protein|nr:N-acetylmuramoyl-L-alanine amidase [Polyangia bacterium]